MKLKALLSVLLPLGSFGSLTVGSAAEPSSAVEVVSLPSRNPAEDVAFNGKFYGCVVSGYSFAVMYLGVGAPSDARANRPGQRQVAVTFLCDRTGMLRGVRDHFRVNQPGKEKDTYWEYSGGDARPKFEFRKVIASNDPLKRVPDTSLNGLISSTRDGHELFCKDGESFDEYILQNGAHPLFPFAHPVPVVAGQYYALVSFLADAPKVAKATQDWAGDGGAYPVGRGLRAGPYYKDDWICWMRTGPDEGWSLSKNKDPGPAIMPAVQLQYTDNVLVGTPGMSSGSPGHLGDIKLGGNIKVRQKFVAKRDFTAKAIWLRPIRTAASAGPLTYSIQHGNELLISGEFPSNDVTFPASVHQSSIWRWVSQPAVFSLRRGDVYHVELSCPTEESYWMRGFKPSRALIDHNPGTRDLVSRDDDLTGGKFQKSLDDGKTWVDVQGEATWMFCCFEAAEPSSVSGRN